MTSSRRVADVHGATPSPAAARLPRRLPSRMTRLLAGSLAVLTACMRSPPREPPAPTPAGPIDTSRTAPATVEPKRGEAASRDAICPPGAVMNASIASIDMAALVAAFPRNPFGWRLDSADVLAVKLHGRWI